MKFSKRWLMQHLDAEIGTAELVERLTMAGLEVDGIEPASAGFSGVVVGEIEAVEPHPDADQLRICRVRGSGAVQQVVCGAPNAAQGLKAPFAEPGARLPDGLAVAAIRLRGVDSAGMLCSAAELGLSADHQGLLELDPALVTGTDLWAALELDDDLIEVDLTPNRGDCLSIRGLARETAVVTGTALRDFPIAPVAPEIEDRLPIRLLAGAACPRYAGRVVRGIDPGARTPQWLQERELGNVYKRFGNSKEAIIAFIKSRPVNGIPGRRSMPQFNMTDQELNALAEFLKWTSEVKTARNWPPNIQG